MEALLVLWGTLKDYASAHRDVLNVIPEFVRQPGLIGVNENGTVSARYGLENYIYCSWDVRRDPASVHAFLTSRHPDKYPITAAWSTSSAVPARNPPPRQSEKCPGDTGEPESHFHAGRTFQIVFTMRSGRQFFRR